MITIDDKNQLEEEIIDEMFKRVLTNQPKNETFFTSYLYKKLEELFKIEVNSLGLKYNKSNPKKSDVLFEVQPKKDNSITGGFKFTSEIPKITIYSYHHNYYDIMSSDPVIRLKALRTFLKTLFHELRHLKQYLLTQQNVSNKNVLRNAKEFLLLTDQLKKYNKTYKDNHDNFAIEADAIIKSYNKLISLTKDDNAYDEEINQVSILESNRDYNDIIFNNKSFNRDLFVSTIIDNYIKNNEKHNLFELMPVLLKEYNEDGTKKNISTLITNLNNELLLYDLLDESDNKNELIKDTKEFYYELIYKRFIEKDPFELYEAIRDHSIDELKAIINDIKEYFNKEKKDNLKLLRNKFIAEDTKYANNRFLPKFNNGKIKMNTLNHVELISPDEFVKKLPTKNNETIKLLYNSKFFKNKIPDNGIYILQDNTRISVSAFVENIFLREYESLQNKGNIGISYGKILYKYVKPPHEMDYLIKCDNLNKEFQSKDSLLNNILKSQLMTKSNINVEDEVFELMKVIKDIDNPLVINNIREYMLSNLEVSNNNYYYSFDDEQLRYFDLLLKVSKLLSVNIILNPTKINYFSKFKKQPIIIEINNEINKYYKLNDNKKSIKL